MTRSSNAAFSLLELVLVILILASVAAVLGVRLSAGIAADRLTVGARDLAATLRLAADRAALTGLRQRVVLTVGKETVGLRVEEEAEPLDKPESWSNPGLSWTRPRSPHESVRWAGLVIDPDDDKLRQELELGEAELEIAVIYSPDRQYRLWRSDTEEEFDDGEPRPLELKISSTDDNEPALYLRLEATGRVRVLTTEQKTEEEEARGASK